ncbi:MULTISPECIES: amidohydrolase family protein [unclassified Francisella]|uniref:amidohydrolase family protein n=1 Tax=unclassified Francisella TaxID=2610885 RepID=UPI002E374E2A|nr:MULTISPECIES: amidohydrolase family protein [unclassified Francisella]MED7819002.1 amidohydrolase family protein [Francisella sp. 19S2-4]MED7829841.1 amidohydrolase family protein [Francisella sp. 19S2-10]
MNIIDSHIHFWDLKNGYNDWVKNTNFPSRVTPEGLNADAFVHIEAHSEIFDPLCEYKWLKSEFANKSIKVVAFVDFTLDIDSFEKKTTAIRKYKDIVGIRQIMAKTNKSSYSPFTKDIPNDLEDKLKILQQNNLVFEAQMYPKQFLNILEKIDNSKVTMVIEHFGLPIFNDKESLESWYILINECKQNSNWNFKLSGFELNNDFSHINKALDFIFENIHDTQLCYGSNFPVSHKDNYDFWQSFLHKYINNDTISENVFRNVAQKIYFNN